MSLVKRLVPSKYTRQSNRHRQFHSLFRKIYSRTPQQEQHTSFPSFNVKLSFCNIFYRPSTPLFTLFIRYIPFIPNVPLLIIYKQDDPWWWHCRWAASICIVFICQRYGRKGGKLRVNYRYLEGSIFNTS